MIGVALVSGLAGLWLWSVLNDEDGIFGFIARPFHDRPMTDKWLRCPFCSGAWFSGGLSLWVWHPSVASAVVAALGAAAVTGLLGSYLEGA